MNSKDERPTPDKPAEVARERERVGAAPPAGLVPQSLSEDDPSFSTSNQQPHAAPLAPLPPMDGFPAPPATPTIPPVHRMPSQPAVPVPPPAYGIPGQRQPAAPTAPPMYRMPTQPAPPVTPYSPVMAAPPAPALRMPATPAPVPPRPRANVALYVFVGGLFLMAMFLVVFFALRS